MPPQPARPRDQHRPVERSTIRTSVTTPSHHVRTERSVTIAGKPTIGVGMVGYSFMGATHSQAWRTVARAFDLPLVPRMLVIAGRNEANARQAADRLGWESVETDWRNL